MNVPSLKWLVLVFNLFACSFGGSLGQTTPAPGNATAMGVVYNFGTTASITNVPSYWQFDSGTATWTEPSSNSPVLQLSGQSFDVNHCAIATTTVIDSQQDPYTGSYDFTVTNPNMPITTGAIPGSSPAISAPFPIGSMAQMAPRVSSMPQIPSLPPTAVISIPLRLSIIPRITLKIGARSRNLPFPPSFQPPGPRRATFSDLGLVRWVSTKNLEMTRMETILENTIFT